MLQWKGQDITVASFNSLSSLAVCASIDLRILPHRSYYCDNALLLHYNDRQQTEQRKEIVAIGRYYRLPNKRSAEVTFAIEDAYQGKGVNPQVKCPILRETAYRAKRRRVKNGN